jgi:ABC-type phosphate transport system substrate-binding protein
MADAIRCCSRVDVRAAGRRAFLIGTGLSLFGAPTRAATPTFRVIVNPSNRQTSVPRDFLVELFLKKITRWSDGEVARPVDQRSDSAVRRAFSESVLKRSVLVVKTYWQQRIFSGRGIPPPELDSDALVVEYVLKHGGAVGYVSGACELGGAKVLTVID